MSKMNGLSLALVFLLTHFAIHEARSDLNAGSNVSSSAGNDAVILITSIAGGASVSQQVNARIAAGTAARALRPWYGSMELVNAADSGEGKIDELVRRHQDATHVDVIVLGASDPSFFSNLRRISNLRLVYLGGAHARSMAEWKKLGAKLVIAQSDFTARSALSSARFVRRWAEGWSALDAAQDASGFTSKVSSAIGEYAHVLTPALRAEGKNLDRSGREYDSVAKPESAALSIHTPEVQRQKTPFQAAAVAATTALIPSVEVNTDAVPGAQQLLDRIRSIGWDQFDDLFSSGVTQTPSTDTDPQSREIWIDGDLLKYTSTPLEKWANGQIYEALQHVQGVKFTRTPSLLKIAIYFDQALDIELKDPGQAGSFQPYSIHLPKTVRAEISNDSGHVTLSGLDDFQGEEQDRISVNVKIPVISNRIYLRSVSVDLDTGTALAEAGILGDGIGLVASTQIFAAQIKPKLDLWKSIEDNLPLFKWPKVEFDRSSSK